MTRCRYCEEQVPLLRIGQPGYPYQRDYGPIWVCVKDQAWVGCHPGTETPLGGLANAELRQAKIAAHAAFDPLWKAKMERDNCTKGQARRAGYKWLAKEMGIPWKLCHIGYFNLEECARVVEICNAVRKHKEVA